METVGRLEILVSRSNDDVLIIKYEKERRGTLEGWFSKNIYQSTKDAILKLDLEDFNKISSSLDVGLPTVDRIKPKENKKYKVVLIAIYLNKVSISPYGKIDKYGSGIAKYMVDVKFPDDGGHFKNTLAKAVEDAG